MSDSMFSAVHDMGRMDDIYNSRFGETMAVQGRSFSDEEIRRIVLLLSETEMTISEIAARMRCSCSGVAAINRKWKVRAYNGLRSTWQNFECEPTPWLSRKP